MITILRFPDPAQRASALFAELSAVA